MKTRLFSDIHCEFHRDHGNKFIENINTNDIDILVFAGDVAIKNTTFSFFLKLCEKIKNTKTKILYVHGNHELWHTKREQFVEQMKILEENYNFKWMNNNIEIINEQRFLGTTLWFKERPDNVLFKHQYGDFAYIDNFSNFVYQENKKATKFLEKNMEQGDIIISHFLPSEKCVVEKYKGSQLNRFFVCDMENLIIQRKPKIWMHGHSHSSLDFVLDETRILCNPYGYEEYEENSSFDINILIDI